MLTHSQVITLGAPSAVLPALSSSLAHSANALHPRHPLVSLHFLADEEMWKNYLRGLSNVGEL